MATVLVVDDDPAVRRLVTGVLDRAGHRVLQAADGAAALSLAGAESDPVALLLTDVVMPGLSGEAVAERLRDAHPDLRVVYMSGYSEEELEARGVRAVGSAYLTKPFTPEILSMVVRGVLSE